MTDYNDKLSSFAERLKADKNTTPMQEVKPVRQTRKEKIVRSTVHLPIRTHKQVKVFCARQSISFKDFIIECVNEKLLAQKHTITKKQNHNDT